MSETEYTSREQEVVNLITQRKTSKEIAALLGISLGMVKEYRRSIRRKDENRAFFESQRRHD